MVHLCVCAQGRALQTAASLDEGLSQVVLLGSFSSLDLQNDNRLVHLSAQLQTSQVDCIFVFTLTTVVSIFSPIT